MQTVLIVGANGKVSIEATKIFLENSSFNVDLFLRNAHRILITHLIVSLSLKVMLKC